MDFKLVPIQNRIEMLFEKNDNILTDIILSFAMGQGTWFFNPSWGNKLHLLKKISFQSINLAKQYIEESLQWLIDTGKAKSLNVIVERDSQDFNRMNFKISIEQNNGVVINYETYKRMV